MSLLAQLQERKQHLKPTTTIIRPHPCIQTGMEDLGLSALGGEIEKEHEEKSETTTDKAHQVAAALKHAKHAVVYTGAGVSTSTGICDYRGPNGVWTALAQGRIPDEAFDLTAALPSFSHMAIKTLVDVGLVKFVVSTNLDGLHYKSGLQPLQNLAQLHGSMFTERCCRCHRDKLRPFPIRRGGAKASGETEHPRMTGRHCSCGGGFMDSGIDFGQTLPLRHLGLAEQNAKICDFSLVVGTSLRVAPSSELPFRECEGESESESHQACIVNMMDTPKDHKASIRCYGKSDLFFAELMKALKIEVDHPLSVASLKKQKQLPITATAMKIKAREYLPERSNPHEYVGKAQREMEMAQALFQVEAAMLLAQQHMADGSN
jgi:NAD-dependent SIR2 family protein deacetylase